MRTLVLAFIIAHASAPGAIMADGVSDPQHTVPVEAIGRLIVDEQFLCTAFPIRTRALPADPSVNAGATHHTWLVTAGHCLGSRMVYRQPAIRIRSPQGLAVYPERTHPVFPVGFSGRPPGGFDVAVLEYTSSYPPPTLEPAFDFHPCEEEWLLAVGYSRGVLSLAVGQCLGRNDDGQLVVDAVLSPGASGGPVLIPGTRRVVGIVVEGTPKRPEESIYGCLFRRCPTDRPYTAAPISWILRVVRW